MVTDVVVNRSGEDFGEDVGQVVVGGGVVADLAECASHVELCGQHHGVVDGIRISVYVLHHVARERGHDTTREFVVCLVWPLFESEPKVGAVDFDDAA